MRNKGEVIQMSEHCIKCGAELREEAEFCEECGLKVSRVVKKKSLQEIEKEIEEKVDAEFREREEREFRKQKEKEFRNQKEYEIQEKKRKELLERQREQKEQTEKEERIRREAQWKRQKEKEEQSRKLSDARKKKFFSIMENKRTERILVICAIVIILIWLVPFAIGQIQQYQEDIKQAQIDEENNRIAEEIALDKATSTQLWIKTYGGAGNEYQPFVHGVASTTDGGYIITGVTGPIDSGPEDALLIKTDSNGTVLWNKTYGGPNYDEGYSVSQAKDGGYIIVGWTRIEESNINAWLIKTDKDGIEQWNKTFGGLSDSIGYDSCRSIEGGYIITGNIGLSCRLIKIDENGNEQWNKTLGKGIGQSIQQAEDGGYIIVARNMTIGGKYYSRDLTLLLAEIEMGGWIIKTDANGNKQWEKTFENETFLSINQTSDGGYVIAGETRVWINNNENYRTEPRISLIKTDNQGNKQWQYRQKQAGYTHGTTVVQTTDGGYIVSGSGSFIKIDNKGNEKWNQTFNPGISIQTIKLTANDGYIISGNYNNDICLIKTVGKKY